jgi:hypothetical protein
MIVEYSDIFFLFQEVIKGTPCSRNEQTFPSHKLIFVTFIYKCSVHVRYLSHEGNRAECEIICHKSSKMKTKKYFDFHTKILNLTL